VIKDSLRPDWQTWAWDAWKNNKAKMRELRQDGPAIEFPAVDLICQQVLAVARNDANAVELQYRKHVINNEVEPGGHLPWTILVIGVRMTLVFWVQMV